MCRYGLGLVLQAKLQLLAAAPEEESSPPRKRSLMRHISTMIFSRRSTRRSCSSSYHARDASLNEISEEPDQEEPLSPTKSPKARVPLRNQLSRHITRLFSQSDDLPSKPDPKPRYKTAPFHRFMSETFPGSVKLEEHQVAAIIRHDFFRKVRHPLSH